MNKQVSKAIVAISVIIFLVLNYQYVLIKLLPGEFAFDLLGRYGDEDAVQPLYSYLDNGERLQKEDAGKALGQMGTPKAIDALRKALAESRSSDTLIAAGKGLAVAGDVETLSKFLLEHEDGHAKLNMMDEFCDIGTEEVAKTLALMLDREDDFNGLILEKAARKLGSINSETSVNALIKVLNTSEDQDLQKISAEFLGNLGGEKAEKALIERLKQGDLYSSAEKEIISSLEQIGTPEALAAVTAYQLR